MCREAHRRLRGWEWHRWAVRRGWRRHPESQLYGPMQMRGRAHRLHGVPVAFPLGEQPGKGGRANSYPHSTDEDPEVRVDQD